MPNLSNYLDLLHSFYKKVGPRLGGDVAISIAHNSFNNREETTSPFVNQINSITKSLEMGMGLELDLHWDEDSKDVVVCHSPFSECLHPLLDKTSLKDVLEKISDFVKNNPSRFVFITTEDSYISENPVAVKMVADLFDKYLPVATFKTSDELIDFKQKQNKKADYVGDVHISKNNSVVLASESLGYSISKAQSDQLSKSTNNTIHNKETFVYPRFFVGNYYPYYVDTSIDPIEASSTLKNDDEFCDFFNKARKDNVTLTNSYESALFDPNKIHDKESITRLFNCGVRSFKFDYLSDKEQDARPLLVDKLSLEELLKNGLSDEDAKICNDLLAQNQDLLETAKYPTIINTAYLSPFSGKPMEEFSTISGIVGFGGDRYQEKLEDSKDKYQNYDPLSSGLYSAAFGMMEGVGDVVVESMPMFGGVLKNFVIPTADLYLYSQSVNPFLAGLIVPPLVGFITPRLAENLEFSPHAATALKYGSSSFVKYALDPGASVSDIAINTALAVAAVRVGSYLTRFAAKKGVEYCKKLAIGSEEEKEESSSVRGDLEMVLMNREMSENSETVSNISTIENYGDIETGAAESKESSSESDEKKSESPSDIIEDANAKKLSRASHKNCVNGQI